MKQEIAGVFSRSAPTYDHAGPQYFAYFGRSLVEFAQIQPGSRVLDIACGRGAVLFPAVEAAGPQGEVIGIDLAQRMAELIYSEIFQRAIENARVLQMDAESLQFPDEVFDWVMCGFAVFFFPRLEQALGEIRRLLKPGGHFAISSWQEDTSGKWDWFDQLEKEYLPKPPESEPEAAQSKTAPTDNLFKPEGVEACLTRAGFGKIRIVTQEAEFIYRTEEEWWATLWSHGGRKILEKIEQYHEPVGLAQFKIRTFEGLQTLRRNDGFPSIMRVILAVGEKAGLSDQA